MKPLVLFLATLVTSPAIASPNQAVETLKKIVAQQQSEINARKKLFRETRTPEGSLTVNGELVINQHGEWVGEPANLVGPQGKTGARGLTGPRGPKGDRGDPAIGKKVIPHSCSWTGYVNGWDAQYSYNCPNGKVLLGVSSYHDNHKEDRRFKFNCCLLKVSQ